MDLLWLWYGFLIITFMGLMLGVMWLADKSIEHAQKVWDKVFKPLNKPF